jgi:hypothetical protein
LGIFKHSSPLALSIPDLDDKLKHIEHPETKNPRIRINTRVSIIAVFQDGGSADQGTV